MTEIEVYFRDGEMEKVNCVENLYDLPWNKYRQLESKIKANARVDRDGEIQSLDIDSDDLGEFLVDFQEQMAKMVLEHEGIEIDSVTTRTVKTIVEKYSDDTEELGLKLKKN